ncbi:Polynucleotide 5'-hydroxyl-kinase GRC3 [Debaryomyces fabryi]|uniref:Polynucleotide 5'-hydroxyl-kinase GRC3 n=1 Tax=Debaryomyces fabryi TaxID=58627 RepID=A0A0V1Q266_9ASCO|nr:Polynucleotide 5'-hydroxyl-kinase GRC3 [Debaryomyces fabryi]KSA02569.1 Polynucleotide 5'-hydroxyl-kinase GRC3 [Debaryomyces fabryi]CUM55944.1 unnamed protein product [Debaryomyces fabryi]
MSAYAALQKMSGTTSVLYGASGESDNEKDNETIGYLRNSSDEEAEETEIPIIPTTTPTPNIIRTPSIVPRVNNFICESNFIPNDDNFIVFHDHIIIGLKANEYILINGQCKMTIQRGAILINTGHYVFAHPNNCIPIIASQSQSLPIISSTQVVDRSGIKDTKTEENIHLFSSNYKSVIKLENFYTGLEKIGSYHPPFKRFFYSKSLGEDEELTEYERLFKTYSFEIILKDRGCIGISIEKLWLNQIQLLIADINEDLVPKIIMIIGNKNSGKSTLSKTLLNSLILDNQNAVSYLDLDPGQSEFSIPYCLSLTNHSKPIVGMNIPKTSGDEDSISHYYGFTTPQSQPSQYVSIIKALFQEYDQTYKPRGNHLIINTPGWIKGYGKELLHELTAFINPNQLILLSNNTDTDNMDNSDNLNGLTFQNSRCFQGIYQTSKYSPFQLRMFNKLSYFHQLADLKFDFNIHILLRSPLKISYETANSPKTFKGINMISVLNYDVGLNFELNDLLSMIDTSIMGLYLIDHEYYSSVKSSIKRLGDCHYLPQYLDSTDYTSLINYSSSYNVFMGLCMVHSINTTDEFFNIYLPNNNQTQLTEMITKKDYKLLLVKGDGDIPSPELLMFDMLLKQQEDIKKLNKRRRKNPNLDDKDVLKIPYVTFENKNKIGGIWKTRRNVMRRGHQR